MMSAFGSLIRDFITPLNDGGQITPVPAAQIPMHYLLLYCQSVCEYSLIRPHLASSFLFLTVVPSPCVLHVFLPHRSLFIFIFHAS